MTRLLLWAVAVTVGSLMVVLGVWINELLTRLFEEDNDEEQ